MHWDKCHSEVQPRKKKAGICGIQEKKWTVSKPAEARSIEDYPAKGDSHMRHEAIRIFFIKDSIM